MIKCCAITTAMAVAVVLSCGDRGAPRPRTTTTLDSQTGFVNVGGGQLFYETVGVGDAIVLVHGNAGDHRHWDRQISALANTHQVIRYDVRGFGRSSVPIEGESYSDHEDLAKLLDHLNVRTAHVAGWSMGSGIAIDFALAYPERTTSLISVGPWVFGYSSTAANALFADMAQISAAIAEGGKEKAVDAWMSAPFFSATILDPAAGERFREIANDHSFWALSNSSPKQVLSPSAAKRTGEIRVPTLILTAEHDIPACLEIAGLLSETIPDSRKVVMEGTGHLLPMEKPTEFNRHVLDFLKDVGNEGV